MYSRVNGQDLVTPEARFRRQVLGAAEDLRRQTQSLGPAPLSLREALLADALDQIARGGVPARETVAFAAQALERWLGRLPEAAR